MMSQKQYVPPTFLKVEGIIKRFYHGVIPNDLHGIANSANHLEVKHGVIPPNDLHGKANSKKSLWRSG